MMDNNGAQSEEKWRMLTVAIADYYDMDPEDIQGFVFAVERIDSETEQLVLSSAWSGGIPPWRLDSFVRELLRQVENLRDQ